MCKLLAVFHISIMQGFTLYQPVYCQHITHNGGQEPPYEDYTADNGADQKVQGKDGNAPAEGTASGDDPEKHTVYPKRQTAQEP